MFSRKPSTYTIKDEQDEIFYGIFYQEELIKILKQWKRLEKR